MVLLRQISIGLVFLPWICWLYIVQFQPVKRDQRVSTPIEMKQDTNQWMELTQKDKVVLDIRYATKNNFVKEAVYPCGKCFLKKDVAVALKKVNERLLSKGYQLRLFDCYRPKPVQQKLWNKVPNPNYVANPAKGSMHNRGTAVDLSLSDLKGNEMDMGTPYDFFGKEAHSDYTNLSKAVLDRRALLKKEMEAAGFQSIRTEWWHFSFKGMMPPLYDWEWSCD